jgi:hypothetical protein
VPKADILNPTNALTKKSQLAKGDGKPQSTDWLPLATHAHDSFLALEGATHLIVIALNCPSLCERKTYRR